MEVDNRVSSAAKRQEPAAVHAARSHGDRLSRELVREWDALNEAVESIRAILEDYESQQERAAFDKWDYDNALVPDA